MRFRLLLGACALFILPAFSPAADWHHWRGPWQTGVSPETNLPAAWSLVKSDPNSNLIWKAPHGCRSTPIVMNGRVYVVNYVGDKITQQERTMCLDADSGKVLWEHRFNVFHTPIVSVRLGWTNPAGDPKTGNVYVHGTQGFLFCYDKDGKILWQHSLTEEYGRITGYGGRVTSPTVDEDLVIIGMVNSSWGDQIGGIRYLAFNKYDGTPVWWAHTGNRPKDTYYSVPVIAVIGGQRLLIVGGGDGAVHAIKARTGEMVWSFPLSAGGLHSSPVVDGDYVYIGHGEENLDNNVQGRFVCLDGSKVVNGKPTEVWRADGLTARYASPIVNEGRVYVPNVDGRLNCLDAKTGKKIWSYSYARSTRGSPVLADGKIYVADEFARFVILEPGEKRCKLLHEHIFTSSDGADVELGGTPAVANGRVYLSTSEEIICIGLKNASPAPEPKVTLDDGKAAAPAAHLQIIPAEVALQPGESATFKAKLFDASGRFLKETRAEYSLQASKPHADLKAKISGDTLTISDMLPIQEGFVIGKADGVVGKARVRVVPKLPYTEEFTEVPNGATPAGWVNAKGKFLVATLKDGNKVLKKINDKASPLFARADTYMALPNLKNYTVEADVMGIAKDKEMSDMGVGANRYTLVLAGNIQGLRLLSWEALPRIDKTIPFKWDANKWYRMKIGVEAGKDSATIRGKVWEKGQDEPKVWTIEVTDPRPNLEGSPTLYGYITGIVETEGAPPTPGSDIYYDNVRVSAAK